MQIEFTFSRANRGKGSSAQVHDQKWVYKVQADAITYQTVNAAQLAFMEWFAAEYPYAELLLWEANSVEHGRIASFRCYLPVSTTRK